MRATVVAVRGRECVVDIRSQFGTERVIVTRWSEANLHRAHARAMAYCGCQYDSVIHEAVAVTLDAARTQVAL